MDLNSGSLQLTNDVQTSPCDQPVDFSGSLFDGLARLPEANEPCAAQGMLAETQWYPDSADFLAPDVPSGRRGRDSRSRTITVVLVDDDATDVIAIRRSFWQLKIVNPLVVARNGLEALDMLQGSNGHTKLEAPYVLLLDLNMPRMGGLELLDALRADPLLRRTLVFVMTSSTAPEDRERAYEKNIGGYIVKPRTAQGLTDTIGALEGYWRAIEFPD